MKPVSEESPPSALRCSAPDAEEKPRWDDTEDWDIDIELDLEGLQLSAAEFGRA